MKQLIDGIAYKIQVDGIAYKIQVDGHILMIWDDNGLVASGRFDDNSEQFLYGYFDENGNELPDFGGSSYDIYFNSDMNEAAQWLVCTHPVNG